MPLSVATTGVVQDYYGACRVTGVGAYWAYITSAEIGVDPLRVQVADGRVVADAGGSPRWQASVVVPLAALPTTLGAVEALPFTGRFEVRHEVTLPGGVLASVRVFGGYVDTVTIQRPSHVVTITGAGFEGRLAEDTLAGTIRATKNKTVLGTMKDLINRTFPGAAATIVEGAGIDTAEIIDQDYVMSPGDDPLRHLLDLAQAIAVEVFCSPGGTTALTTAYWQILNVAGLGDFPDTSNLVTPESVLVESVATVRRAPNRVRIRFEPARPSKARPPRTGVAEVTSGSQDPDLMGRVTEFQRRTSYRTQGKADAVAAKVLGQRSRRTRQVTWEQTPAPWLAPGDTVTGRTRPLSEVAATAVDSLVVIRTELPFAPGESMRVTARATDHIEGTF